MKFVLASMLLIPLLHFSADAQAFPWEDFTRRSLKEIVKIDEREINASDRKPRMIAHADKLLSVVRVKYLGKSRPISTAKQDFLRKYWVPLFAAESVAYAELYENDFLFAEGDVEYWLPVQKKVSSYFPKELTPGDEIDIYLVRAGGICKKRECDWAFLIEEFKKPKLDVLKN